MRALSSVKNPRFFAWEVVRCTDRVGDVGTEFGSVPSKAIKLVTSVVVWWGKPEPSSESPLSPGSNGSLRDGDGDDHGITSRRAAEIDSQHAPALSASGSRRVFPQSQQVCNSRPVTGTRIVGTELRE